MRKTTKRPAPQIEPVGTTIKNCHFQAHPALGDADVRGVVMALLDVMQAHADVMRRIADGLTTGPMLTIESK